jgi:hypothetical protein
MGFFVSAGLVNQNDYQMKRRCFGRFAPQGANQFSLNQSLKASLRLWKEAYFESKQ